jgi:hypothetical protein
MKVPAIMDLFLSPNRRLSSFLRAAAGTIRSRAYWLADTITFWRKTMKKNIMNSLAISLAVGASALFMTAASAAPLSADVSVVPANNIQNVRLVCNENGRCWRQHDRRRVIIRDHADSYEYAPRHHRRRGHYEERDGGIGIRLPGVSVGIGSGRH